MTLGLINPLVVNQLNRTTIASIKTWLNSALDIAESLSLALAVICNAASLSSLRHKRSSVKYERYLTWCNENCRTKMPWIKLNNSPYEF